MFVLNVDLWSCDGSREVNLVRHSATSPSISATTPVSYAQVQETSSAAFTSILPGSMPSPQFKYEGGQGYQNAPGAYNPYPGPPQVNPYSQSQAPPQSYGGQYAPGYGPTGPQPGAFPPQNGYQAPPPGATPAYYTTAQGIHAGPQSQPQPGIDYAPASQPLPTHSSLTSYGGRPFTAADVNIHRMPVSSTQPQGKDVPLPSIEDREILVVETPSTQEASSEDEKPVSTTGNSMGLASRVSSTANQADGLVSPNHHGVEPRRGVISGYFRISAYPRSIPHRDPFYFTGEDMSDSKSQADHAAS